MNRLRQMLSLPQLAFLGSALLLLSWLYSQSTAIDAENHLTFVSALRGIKQLDANLNQDVLRTRYNLLTHYDLFVRNLDQLRALAKPLSEEPLASHLKTLDPGLTKAVISLSNSAERKANLIETFKSHNAVLKNSLRYFPTAATHLISHSQRSQQVHLYQEAENLQRDVLALNLISSQDTDSDIRARLSRLRALLPALPAELAAETVSVVNHAETILRTKHEVDALTSQILMAR